MQYLPRARNDRNSRNSSLYVRSDPMARAARVAFANIRLFDLAAGLQDPVTCFWTLKVWRQEFGRGETASTSR